MALLSVVRMDEYLRVLDLRHNKFTAAVLQDSKLDFVTQICQNESITNLDLRLNEGLTKDVKFRLSLMMIRNIDRLRKQGTMVNPEWLNKDVLMLKETLE
jgi:hypothetical protein